MHKVFPGAFRLLYVITWLLNFRLTGEKLQFLFSPFSNLPHKESDDNALNCTIGDS